MFNNFVNLIQNLIKYTLAINLLLGGGGGILLEQIRKIQPTIDYST
jgi:hypothetical protein